MNLGSMQMSGVLFIADPPGDSFIEVKLEVLGILQAEVVAHVGEPAIVAITLPEGLFSVTFTFDVPTSSFICQARPNNSKTEAEWHLLTALTPA
jgi:hypothetical protein